MRYFSRQTPYQVIWLAGLILFFISLVLLSYAINYGLSNARGYGYVKEKLADYIVAANPMNATFNIDGQEITLENGLAQERIAGATFKNTRIWGEGAVGDINNDGADDYAFLITQDSGGSGNFFYVAAAFNAGQGYLGTNAILLGDRIAPQNISVTGGLILVNYADRLPGEPMTAQPSQGASAYFELKAGNLVQVYPNQSNLIQVTLPLPNSVISSPVVIKGQARGNWYFEASFPVKLFDANNNEVPLTPGYIMAQGDWMTTDFVPFQASLTFSQPATATGRLVLQKDNPSGLPEYDDEITIPVRFEVE